MRPLLAATIKLAPLLPTSVAVCGFPGVEEAVSAVGEIINKGVTMRGFASSPRRYYPLTSPWHHPECVELCDTLMMHAINKFGNISMDLPEADSIFFKFQGPTAASIQEAVGIVEAIAKKHGGKDLIFAQTEEQSDELWRARKAAHWSAMALVEGGTCYSTDVCVPPSNLPQLVKQTKEDLQANGICGPILGWAE